MSDPVSARYFFYLEGVKTPFKSAIINSQANGVASAAVVIAFDRRQGLIRQIRAKTLGHLFFLDTGGDLRLIFEGELMGKAYAMTPTGPTASLSFAGIGANYQNTRYTLLPAQGGAPGSPGGLLNQAGIWLVKGVTVGVAGVPTSTPVLAAPLIRNDILTPFQGASGSGGFDYPKAFQGFLQTYIADPSPQAGASITNGSTAAQYLRIAEFRFSLVEGITGATSAELADLFFGQAASGGGTTGEAAKGKTEKFLYSVLSTIQDESNLLTVMLAIANTSLHTMSELICPPMVGPRGGGAFVTGTQDLQSGSGATPSPSISFPSSLTSGQFGGSSLGPTFPPLSGGAAAQPPPATAPGAGTGLAAPEEESLASGAKGSRNTLGRMFVFPMLYNADPPTCNLFLPHMVNSVSYGVQCVKPTRLLTTQVTSIQNLAAPTFLATILPESLQDKVFATSEDAGKKVVNLSNATTKEEAEVGVLMVQSSNHYPGNVDASQEDMEAWMRKTADLRFYAARSENQEASISMDFNPYPVVGLPGAFADTILGQGRGLVLMVQHTLTPQTGSTTVAMGACFFDGDAVENPDAMASVETGYDGQLELFKNGHPSTIYESVLGVESLTKAAAHITANPTPAPGTTELPDIIDIVSALDLVVQLTNSADSESARAAEVDFVSRPIATYADLVRFYGGADQAENQAEVNAANAAVKAADTKGIPEILGFAKPFISKDNQRLVSSITVTPGKAEIPSTATTPGAAAVSPVISGTTGPLVGEGDTGLFNDRRAPVINYLNDQEQ